VSTLRGTIGADGANSGRATGRGCGDVLGPRAASGCDTSVSRGNGRRRRRVRDHAELRRSCHRARTCHGRPLARVSAPVVSANIALTSTAKLRTTPSPERRVTNDEERAVRSGPAGVRRQLVFGSSIVKVSADAICARWVEDPRDAIFGPPDGFRGSTLVSVEMAERYI